MTKLQKAGTGEKLGEIDCGDVGTIQLADDGDEDSYVVFYFNGKRVGITDVESWFEMGDDGFADALDTIGGEQSTSTSATTYRSGPFICDECNRTWPSKKNEGSGDRDICPDCS